MRLSPSWLVAAAVLGFVAFKGYGCVSARDARIKEQIADLESRNAVLEESAGRVDTLYRWRTDTLRIVRRRTDARLERDTVFTRDTVRLIMYGERRACDAVVLACAQKVEARDSIIANLNRRLGLEKKLRPGWLRRQASHIPWILGGVVAGKVLLK